MRGSGQRLPITLRFTRVLGTFSHTTCFPFSCALWACFSDRSVSGERNEPIGALMPHAALWVVQRVKCFKGFPLLKEFQCRTRLFPFAPTTASRSPSPAHAGEAWLRAVFSQNHAILASPADAGERSTSANHTSFYSCSWDVFPYDLFPVQLCPMGLLLGQVSKWRAQRADRGAHAARGFVGGAAR